MEWYPIGQAGLGKQGLPHILEEAAVLHDPAGLVRERQGPLLHAPVLHLAFQRHRLELSTEGCEQRGARLDETPVMILRGLEAASLVRPRALHPNPAASEVDIAGAKSRRLAPAEPAQQARENEGMPSREEAPSGGDELGSFLLGKKDSLRAPETRSPRRRRRLFPGVLRQSLPPTQAPRHAPSQESSQIQAAGRAAGTARHAGDQPASSPRGHSSRSRSLSALAGRTRDRPVAPSGRLLLRA